MNQTLRTIGILLLALSACSSASYAASVFDLLDLSRPGLEEVARLHSENRDSLASVALLDYFRARTGVRSVGVDAANPKISAEEQKWADEGLEHRFFVHKGYQPSYFYGDDIDWTYWPVKDNELRWQLHRTKWWVPMGKAYRLSGDEKYAKEWVAQYRDWIRKNPLTEFAEIKDSDMEEVDNVYFAWRPLEVCDRLEHQIEQFELFLPSEHFTPGFLMEFLANYHKHADFANTHYSAEGNHLLFEAQRIIFAGAFFPEFKDAASWREAGVDILNREIKKQVLADGVQYELDPGYHMACIGIFGKALRMMDANGYRGEFPQEYLDTMRKMTAFTYNLAFPDYTLPMFSDNKLHDKASVQGNYRSWLGLFPDDEALRYFATDGSEGKLPDHTSRAFPDGGFYVFRSGWTPESIVMTLKAGPEGEWHNQYDNGTFELWRNGRNFFPDSGSYVFGGDSTVLKDRNWFRQTSVHNTLTLDDRTLEHRRSRLLQWDPTPGREVVVVETPGYEGLTHRRTVFFVDNAFFVIADEAYGDAVGDVALHYQLLPCTPAEDFKEKTVATSFGDGNDMVLKVFGAESMEAEQGWTSPAYRERHPRPAYAFGKAKKAPMPVRFITVIHPGGAGVASPKISASYAGDFSADGVALEVNVGGTEYKLSSDIR